MAWSAENATRAYLSALKSGNKGMEPDVAEFVSALAAGSCARLIVVACSGPVGPTTLAMVAAAQQTGGRVVCVIPSCEFDILERSYEFLGTEAAHVELVIGDVSRLLAEEYKGADFVLVDCEMEEQERVFKVAQSRIVEGCARVVVGYNAFSCERPSGSGDLRVDLLPIGGGVRVCRVPARAKRSRWVVRVDECTGEEHVYRITSQYSTSRK